MLTNHHQQSDSGFSIIEALVAITVLLLAFAGPLTIVARGLNTALLAQENVTAFFLAQEGIELVLERRDSHVLDNLDDNNKKMKNGAPVDAPAFWQWRPSECGGAPTNASKACGLDVAGNVADCSSNMDNCDIWKHSGLPHWRIVSSSETTKYNRIINIDMTNDSAHITSTVTWDSFLGSKDFTAETYIYNVYGHLPI